MPHGIASSSSSLTFFLLRGGAVFGCSLARKSHRTSRHSISLSVQSVFTDTKNSGLKKGFFFFVRTDSIRMYVRRLYWTFLRFLKSAEMAGTPKTP
jgi:hypothetical protein